MKMVNKLHKRLNIDKGYKKDMIDKGYYNVVYKKGIYLEHNLNGSFTISDDKGNKQTYYGYNQRDALNKFKRETKR